MDKPAIDWCDNTSLARITSYTVCYTKLLWLQFASSYAELETDPNTGETKMEIEAHATGLVLVDGELWPARSKTPIPSGSMVRVIRHNGYVITSYSIHYTKLYESA